MYEDEPRKKIPLLVIVAAFIFGAGSLWLGSYGFDIAAMNSPALRMIASVFSFAGSTPEIAFNQAKLTANVFAKSYIDKSPSEATTTTVMIAGDIMLDRKIRYLGETKGYENLLASVEPLFHTADIVIANLEGPITSNPSKTLLSNGKMTSDLAFTFAPQSTEALTKAGITAVSLANNHEYNFGLKGVNETKEWLKEAEIGWFGDPWNKTSTEFEINKNSMTVAFVGYHAFEPGIDGILADVKRLTAKGDFVIVMPHWGDEYSSVPNDKMRSYAKAFVTAGAKAVIGSHPHVIMEHEMIAGVPVYYSIGNLLFDQYFSDAVMNGEIVSLKLVNGPAGPSIESIMTYNTRLDKSKGVVVK